MQKGKGQRGKSPKCRRANGHKGVHKGGYKGCTKVQKVENRAKGSNKGQQGANGGKRRQKGRTRKQKGSNKEAHSIAREIKQRGGQHGK